MSRPSVLNLFKNLPARHVPDEEVELLAQGKNTRVERIVSDGQASPPDFWYDQEEDEWVTLLSGSATLQFEEYEVELAAGDCLNIAAHTRHRVAATSDTEQTIWLAVFY